MSHLCIKPACPVECSGCNHAISEQEARDYAIRYAWLRAHSYSYGAGSLAFGRGCIQTMPELLDTDIDAITGAAASMAPKETP